MPTKKKAKKAYKDLPSRRPGSKTTTRNDEIEVERRAAARETSRGFEEMGGRSPEYTEDPVERAVGHERYGRGEYTGFEERMIEPQEQMQGREDIERGVGEDAREGVEPQRGGDGDEDPDAETFAGGGAAVTGDRQERSERRPAGMGTDAGARVAFLVDEDFEDSELRLPFDRIRDAGHEAVIVGIEAGKPLVGKRGKERVTTQLAARGLTAADFDAVVIPGGYSPDHLRTNRDMVRLTRDMFHAGKPVAAVCHGPSLLIEADIVEGHKVTSWPSIKTDLVNAGARWADREVVEDGRLVTSRKPDDLDAFTAAILRHLEREVAETRTRARRVQTAQGR
jgi:protease I